MKILQSTLIVACLSTFAAPAAAGTKVILVIGQSNAGSTAKLSETDNPTKYGDVRKHSTIYSRHHPYEMFLRPGRNTQGLSFAGGYRNTFGIETPMVDMLAKHRPNDDFVVIKQAYGGTCISKWLKSLLNNTIQLVSKSGYTPDAVVWIQGECDSRAPTSNYTSQQRELITRVKNKYGNIPFFDVLLKSNQHINASKNAVYMSKVYRIAADGVSFKDHVHYDTRSTIMMGKRIANYVNKYMN